MGRKLNKMSTKTSPTITFKCTKNTIPSGYGLVEPEPQPKVFCGGDEIAKFRQEVYVEGECDNCGCGVGFKADITEQSKKHYSAAMSHYRRQIEMNIKYLRIFASQHPESAPMIHSLIKDNMDALESGKY